MLPHVFVKASERKWQGREWKVQCPRRSADNVWELQQLASIPACGICWISAANRPGSEIEP